MVLELKEVDVKAHMLARSAFPVYSLGTWRKRGDRNFTPLGTYLHELKYEALSERQVEEGVSRLVDLMLPEMKRIWPNYPADFCISVPPNLPRSRDLPARLARHIGLRTRIKRNTEILHLTRRIPSMKNTPRKERPVVLDRAYSAQLPSTLKRGLLVVDDVYDSGSTVRAVRQAFLRAGIQSEMNFFVIAHISQPNSKWEVVT